MNYKITYDLEPYPVAGSTHKWCIMGRAYDGTGKLYREDSLTGPFEKDSLELWIQRHNFSLEDKQYTSGQTWRGQRLP